MATTPEGKVKQLVTAVLREFAPDDVWFTMPVPSGYGESTLDYIGCCVGYYFAIETKKPGGKPTLRQHAMIDKMRASGGKVFVIDGPEGVQELREWISATRSQG